MYVNQLSQTEQDVIQQNLTDLCKLEGYTGEELEQAIQGGMDSKLSDLNLYKVEKCTVCNEPTDEGFILNGDIHCSVACRQQTMSDEAYAEAHAEDDDSFYWTSWYGEEY